MSVTVRGFGGVSSPVSPHSDSWLRGMASQTWPLSLYDAVSDMISSVAPNLPPPSRFVSRLTEWVLVGPSMFIITRLVHH